jgi:hypothetical protein
MSAVSPAVAPTRVDWWYEVVNEETIRRFWVSVTQPNQRTMICVLLWTARKEFHGSEANRMRMITSFIIHYRL